jgi:hypothetical protein
LDTTEPFCIACSQIKLAVSRKLCGAVIGQKGQTIRDFMQDSGATIRVQPLSELTPSDSERLITISGARDKVLRAVALILNTVSSCGSLLHARSAVVCSRNVAPPVFHAANGQSSVAKAVSRKAYHSMTSSLLYCMWLAWKQLVLVKTLHCTAIGRCVCCLTHSQARSLHSHQEPTPQQ